MPRWLHPLLAICLILGFAAVLDIPTRSGYMAIPVVAAFVTVKLVGWLVARRRGAGSS